MPSETIVIIAATVIVHFLGIGLFLFWMAAGHPMSVAEFRRNREGQKVPR